MPHGIRVPLWCRRSAKGLARVMAAILLLGLIALTAVAFIVSRGNTLNNNGNWIAGKMLPPTHLRPRENEHFMGELQTLAGNHLDLGVWQGFQEVLLKMHNPRAATL